ncbi:inovirus-type Gp2 protein [Escherichia coli]|nr:inovirus Gp2 family protein [Escherichia coli]EGI4185928.1 inovirus Gp2 family protein [Escherichia coli]EHW7992272.1 inovirus-type Gp2 protein [Escherichia coli]EJA1681276.1 inovirus-type Gp2 protein [Escherichia coli]EKE0799233.1 inovirus-type Gp2 protein [Escherichia coli]
MKKPYNANPNYPMNRLLLEDINHHLDEMFERYSRLLAFRMDFGWKQGSERSQRNLMDEMEGEIQHLMDVVFGRKMVIGYCWVIEYRQRKGLHVHAMLYLDGQKHRKCYPTSRAIGEEWRRLTDDEGLFHLCSKKKHFVASSGTIVDHRNKQAVDELRYVISYLAKSEQKSRGVIAGMNAIPPRSRRGRPRKE